MDFKIHRAPRHLTACILVLFCSVATFAQSKQEARSRANVEPSETTFNLADFGAIGDGVADDGPALQSALDAIKVAGGGTLLIPSGKYLIATPVVEDFSSVNNATLTIQGIPSETMPAPPTAGGNELAAGLNLSSELIPATGELQSAITLSNIHQLLIEHVGFTGREAVASDALITLSLRDIDEATVRHCEFYGLYSVFGNIISAVRSELSIELTVFLGCSANSGVYGPIVENLEWRRFSIANSIFLDYGLRAFFGKTGHGAPFSWINIGNAKEPTPESPRREVIVRDTFLDEGGWIGFSVLPYRFCEPCPPIDLIYISGLKMNVSNLNAWGHLIYDTQNVLIENSHYGWSHLTQAAIEINRSGNVILDKLTCIDSADRIKVDAATQRVTVINSVYGELASLSPSTTVMQTSPQDDPVQYVRQRFNSVLGRQPEPAAHFYWSDMLIRCGNNNECLNQTRSELDEYLNENPPANFTITGTALDENGAPLVGATVNLTGSQSVVTTTDSQGSFRFSRLPTSGNYNVSLSKRHYHFLPATQNIRGATADTVLTFEANLNLFAISGIAIAESGAPLVGATVNLTGSQSVETTTDTQGRFRFSDLPTIGNYDVTLSKPHFHFVPATQNITDATGDMAFTFEARLNRFAVTGTVLDETGAPFVGATVNLTGSLAAVTTTDSQGSFQFSGLPTSGDYNVRLSKPNYTFLPANQNITDATGDMALTFEARPTLFAITGTVLDENGAPLSGATVNLTGSQSVVTTTDSQGGFRLPGLPTNGNYNVTLSKRHYHFVPATQNITATADTALTFEARLNRFAISGVVFHENGAPLGGVTVNLTGSQSVETTTDTQGRFRFPGLPTNGNYDVTLSKPHYHFVPATQNITDAAGDMAFTFEAWVNRFVVTGTVLDETGAPLVGASVNLTGSVAAVTTTDSQGSFQFSALPTSGNYNVTPSKRHYTFLPATQNITDVTDDMTITFDARLNRHAIAGRIAGVNGASISGILVRLEQSPEVTQTTDVNGNYSFTQVPAGKNYTVIPQPNTDFLFAPVTTTFSDLSGNQTANFVGWLRPEITTVPGSNIALALDSVTFSAQPFSLFNSLDFNNDGFLRVTIFAKRVEPSATLSQVSLLAEDTQGEFHPLQIEQMGNVPGQSWLTQFNLKLEASTYSNSCIKVMLTVASVPSNEARICLGQVIDLPSGNPNREP